MSENKPDKTDLTDSEKDKNHLKPDEAAPDMPEVKDIPGQEHVHVPHFSEFADVTISSDDEEGKGILDDLNEGNEADVSVIEKQLLEDAATDIGTEDEKGLRNAKMDDIDFEKEPLNEKDDVSGDDLDIPGSENDDDNESIGEEDEENNLYSLGDNK